MVPVDRWGIKTDLSAGVPKAGRIIGVCCPMCCPCNHRCLEQFTTINLTVRQPHRAIRRGCQEAISQPEDSSMSRRFIVAMLGLALALFFIPQISLAEEDHIAEAIMHTKQAIDHGKQGHADVLTTHAEAALTHAEAGEKVKANAHTEEGITHLKQAIDEGKKGNAKMATTHAEAALTHLEQVK